MSSEIEEEYEREYDEDEQNEETDEGDYGEGDDAAVEVEEQDETERAEKGATTFKQATQQIASGEGDIDPKTLEGKIKLTIIKYTKEYFSDRSAQENIFNKIIEGKLYSIEELATYNIPYIVAITIWNNKKGLLNIVDPKNDESIKDFTDFATQIDSKFNLADPPAYINTTTLYRYYRLIKNKIDVNIDVYRYIEILNLNVKADFFDALFQNYGFNEFNDIPSKLDKNNLFLLYYWFTLNDNTFTLEPPKKKGDDKDIKLQKLVKFFNEKKQIGESFYEGKIEISSGNDIVKRYFVNKDKVFMIDKLKNKKESNKKKETTETSESSEIESSEIEDSD